MSLADIQKISAEKHQSTVGLRTAVTIMERWGASREQMSRILRVSGSTLARAKAGNGTIALDNDQLDRISYVLNIHGTLRLIFDNPDNVYGFLKLPNDNAFFNGRQPLSVMADGSFASLYETFRRIDGLRGAMW
ncbi:MULTISPECIES: antitoxin Xre-like helix-turn-helix domain-containing protein [Halopseudomonas]|uniref:Antitoxin Xre-like helix-turn-helix domain-containing protein n=1 Tax=Halopseudomonas bauzanensis TaxID=653930 RepID=A0A1I4PMQ2_9GAMM|nr:MULTISPECIES: antitoxin Xre-like helix-turn-helix domain-containing protein [Halopseudomonas]WGK63111.1 hypothetical protein QAO71_07855 [Halopseudomonas sp. SMJS2]SES29508.1 hypothetical protein SAMN05216589_3045 [Halopseudomonas bauzanensis]SFM29079.1 hypothetical protein SAMN04487855_3043 [Halopseudomonas bauzanensis]